MRLISVRLEMPPASPPRRLIAGAGLQGVEHPLTLFVLGVALRVAVNRATRRRALRDWGRTTVGTLGKGPGALIWVGRLCGMFAAEYFRRRAQARCIPMPIPKAWQLGRR